MEPARGPQSWDPYYEPNDTCPEAYGLEVLWNQPLSTVNHTPYLNQEIPNWPDYSTYLADDFVSVEPWQIDSVFVPGTPISGSISLLDATALTWQVYADDGGVPAGDPSGGGSPPAWEFTLPPDDPRVVITAGTGGALTNVRLNLESQPVLQPGHWWLVFYPTMGAGLGLYGRDSTAPDTVS